MKSLIKKSFILSVLAMITGIATVQASDCYNYKVTSAQVADMFRYGDAETSLFTGRLNLSIPIYSLDDPDFDLNIALRYNAEGFKPRKHSGYVGYSWFLEAGGCITREVHNYADETCRRIAGGGKSMMGMLMFVNQNSANKFNKDSVYNFSSTVGQSCLIGGNDYTWNLGHDCAYYIDYLPDIFHFNFCGYQGSFMIDNAGNPVIISGDYMKIDLSDLVEWDCYSTSDGNLLPRKITSITLTSKDGYKYVFGGDLSSVGYTISLHDSRTWDVQYPPVINSWHLKKVIAPNNRQISFYYKQPNDNSGYMRRDSLLELNEYLDLFAIDDILHHSPRPDNPPDPPIKRVKMNMSRICVLDSIVVSGAQPLHVEFFNRADRKSLYGNPGIYGDGDQPCMLDSIHIVSGTRIVRKASLSYEYKANEYSTPNYAHYWRFLKEVFISGTGTYSMQYNQGLGPYPSLEAASENGYYQVVDYYGFDANNPFRGMLSRIDFPTGGKQEFTYHEHEYGKERKFVRDGFLSVIMTTNSVSFQSTSGVRIQEIKTYSSSTDTSPIETKSYTYTTSSSNSSGVHYNNRLIYIPSNNGGYLVPDANAYSMLDTHIGYSHVEETTKDASNNILSKIGYTFDVGVDTYVPDFNIPQEWQSSGNNECSYAVLSGMLTYHSKLTHVGHLLAKDYYRNNDLIRSELYCYNGIASSPYHFIPVGRSELGITDTIAIYSHFATPVTRKLYVYPDVMQQHVTQDYVDGSIPIYINRCYVYDRKLRVKREYIRDSQNKWLFTQYSYPDEYSMMVVFPEYPNIRTPLSVLGPISHLNLQHRINLPLQILSGYEDINANEYITAGKLNLYASRMLLINMDSTYDYTYLSKTLELSIANPITDYQPLSYNIETPSYDNRYKLTCEYLCGPSLRPIRIAPYGKMPTTYTWNGIYPATKTTGGQTYTYTYLPHVGVSSITDPRGITTYYSYDDQGRLIETYQIVNEKKQILNAYHYHIKTE